MYVPMQINSYRIYLIDDIYLVDNLDCTDNKTVYVKIYPINLTKPLKTKPALM